MKKYSGILLIVFSFCFVTAWSQVDKGASFKVIPLGVKGGIDESNLSAYMLAAAGTDDYVCLDAGTLHYGIQKAVDEGLFKVSTDKVLRNYIKAYLISHAHLDHLAGLIINSPDDTAKNIYAMPYCLAVLRDNYFTWKSWANFASEGDKPQLNKYHYTALDTITETAIQNTGMTVKAFTLSHGTAFKSTAFLIRQGDKYVLYLGDTGADEIEKSNNLQLLWQAVAPLVKTGQLKGIFIEVSYPNQQPHNLLFGHLTPQLLMHEMQVLSSLTGNGDALKGLPVIITHMKPSGNHEAEIKTQLNALNSLHLNILFAEQGKQLNL